MGELIIYKNKSHKIKFNNHRLILTINLLLIGTSFELCMKDIESIFHAMLTYSNGSLNELKNFNELNEVNLTKRVKHIPNVITRNIS